MRKSDLPNNPDIFGRSNYLSRELLAFVEAAEAATNAGATALLAYWDANATIVRGKLVAASTADPTVTVAPSIAGTPTSGQTLTCTPGTYTGSPTITRQWLADGVALSGATGLTLVLGAPHVGKVISCRETATNAGGSIQSTSNSLGPVA